MNEDGNRDAILLSSPADVSRSGGAARRSARRWLDRLGRVAALGLAAIVAVVAGRRRWIGGVVRGAFDRARPEFAGGVRDRLESPTVVLTRRGDRAEAGRGGDPSRRGPSPSRVIALAHRPDAIEVVAGRKTPSGEIGEGEQPIVLPTGDLVIRRPRGEVEIDGLDEGSMRPALETWIDRARRSRDDRGEKS